MTACGPSSLEVYRRGLAQAMDVELQRFADPGISVVGDPDRLGRRSVSHYAVGDHSVLWVDPNLVDELEADVATWADVQVTGDAVSAWARERATERLGVGYEHLLIEAWTPRPRPEQIRVLDGRDETVVRLVEALHAACDPDDAEEADFDLDDLDEHLVGWFDADRLVGLAGGRSFDDRPGCHDIGVLVAPDARRRGVGAAAVAAVVDELVSGGRVPLYRCNAENEASWRLCATLGFRRVLELEAFRWPDDS